MKKVCFLDLDGVLVDFVGGALKVHGKSVPYDDIRWGFPADIGFSGVDDPKFWEPMGHDFWAGLDWMSDGRDILRIVEDVFGGDVALMTSPCLTPGGVEGKVAWVARHLPNYRRRLFVGAAKYLAAGYGKILVDDHDANCDKFEEYGGVAVMVPRPWNRQRGWCEGGTFDLGDFVHNLRVAAGSDATVNTPAAVARGPGSVAIGGSVTGGTIITGRHPAEAR